MRYIFITLLIIPNLILAQEECALFNLQQLSQQYLSLEVDSALFESSGNYRLYLSNGREQDVSFGCTNPSFIEFSPSATVDDGTCATEIELGCTDAGYAEYDANANTDDGSCSTLICVSPEYDGYFYDVVQIGEQCWFAENLRSFIFSNGDSIPFAASWGNNTELAQMTVYGTGGSGCVSQSPLIDACNEESSFIEFGALYNVFAAIDGRGICPSGWSLPSAADWTELLSAVSSEYPQQPLSALKSGTGWAMTPDSLEGNGFDAYGFDMKPSGIRSNFYGGFAHAGTHAWFWSSGPGCRGRFATRTSESLASNCNNSYDGLSIRCIKD